MHDSTLLHRQVHPNFVQKTEVSSQVFEATSSVFTPTSKDDKKLSVYNGDKFSVKEAFDHYVADYLSVGVLSVTVEEVKSVGLSADEDNIPFDGHAYIDYSTCETNGKIKSKAKLLKKKAFDRGWMHLVQP